MVRLVLSVRIEQKLIKELQEEAKQENRSLNNHIETILFNRHETEESDEKSVS